MRYPRSILPIIFLLFAFSVGLPTVLAEDYGAPSDSNMHTSDHYNTSKQRKAGDDFFGGSEVNEDEDIAIENENPDYLKARRKLFIGAEEKFKAHPLRLTLEDCIRIALVNNSKVQATEYGIESAKAKADEASARFWPVFEYSWLTAPVPGDFSNAVGSFFHGDIAWWNKLTFNVGIPIYAFGKLDLAKSMAEEGILAARENKRKERISVVTQIRQLYYGALLAKEMERLLLKAHEKLLNEIEKKKDGRSPIERAKAMTFLIELENRIADARNKEALALEGLRVQMGLNPDVAITVYSERLRPIKTVIKPLDEYVKMALENRPDLKLAEIGVNVQGKKYELEKRKFLPDVGIGAHVDIGRSVGGVRGVTTTDNWSNPVHFTRAGVGMRVEGKIDIHGQSARIRGARSDYYKASLERYMANDAAILDVKKAYLDVDTAYDNIVRSDVAQKYARQLLFLTQNNFELGIGNEEDYVNALQLVLLTRGKYFESVFNYNVALAVLEEKAGILPDVDIYH